MQASLQKKKKGFLAMTHYVLYNLLGIIFLLEKKIKQLDIR